MSSFIIHLIHAHPTEIKTKYFDFLNSRSPGEIPASRPRSRGFGCRPSNCVEQVCLSRQSLGDGPLTSDLRPLTTALSPLPAFLRILHSFIGGWTLTVHGQKFSKYLSLIINHLRQNGLPTSDFHSPPPFLLSAFPISAFAFQRQPAKCRERTASPTFHFSISAFPLPPHQQHREARSRV